MTETFVVTIAFDGLTEEQVKRIVAQAHAAAEKYGGTSNADITRVREDEDDDERIATDEICAQCERPILNPLTAVVLNSTDAAGKRICADCDLTNFIEEQNEELETDEW